MDVSLLLIILCSYIKINTALNELGCKGSNTVDCKYDDVKKNFFEGDDNYLGLTSDNQYKIELPLLKEEKGEMLSKKTKTRHNRKRHQKRNNTEKKKDRRRNQQIKTSKKLNVKKYQNFSKFQEYKMNSQTKIKEINQNFNKKNEIPTSSFQVYNNILDMENLKKSFDLKHGSDNGKKEYNPVVSNRYFPSNDVNSAYNKTIPSEYKYTSRNDEKPKLRPQIDVKNAVVRTHNILRGKVFPSAENMLAMSWSSTAAEHAQRWADKCLPGSEPDHPSQRWTRTFGSCGQNVFVAFKKKRWSSVLRSWWNERRNFHYGYSENNITLIGKYTQMAWYNSHKVGCASTQCANQNGKKFYRYVCNYCPSGNDPGRIAWPYNQGEQCGACPQACISVCRTKQCRLCTNHCPLSDLWNNCLSLFQHWKNWLCNTKTADGVMRFKNCRATCQCQNKIT